MAIQVEFRRLNDEGEDESAGTILLSTKGLTLTPEDSVLLKNVVTGEVFDPVNKDRITIDQDPARWFALLPYHYRGTYCRAMQPIQLEDQREPEASKVKRPSLKEYHQSKALAFHQTKTAPLDVVEHQPKKEGSKEHVEGVRYDRMGRRRCYHEGKLVPCPGGRRQKQKLRKRIDFTVKTAIRVGVIGAVAAKVAGVAYIAYRMRKKARDHQAELNAQGAHMAVSQLPEASRSDLLKVIGKASDERAIGMWAGMHSDEITNPDPKNKDEVGLAVEHLWKHEDWLNSDPEPGESQEQWAKSFWPNLDSLGDKLHIEGAGEVSEAETPPVEKKRMNLADIKQVLGERVNKFDVEDLVRLAAGRLRAKDILNLMGNDVANWKIDDLTDLLRVAEDGENNEKKEWNENSAKVKQNLYEMGLVPPHLLQQVADAGTHFYFGAKTVPGLDENEDKKGVKPQNWPENLNATWDDAAGMYKAEKGKRQVAVGIGGEHSSASLAIHTVAHAFGNITGLENSGDLMDHYERLFTRLPPHLKDPRKTEGEPPGPGARNKMGRRELFAEGVATRLMKGRERSVMLFDEEFVDWLERRVLADPEEGEFVDFVNRIPKG